MLHPKESLADVGVIVGRFQTPELTGGHQDLIESVLNRHKKVLILIGSTPGLKVTKKNPLDYYTRMIMIRETYPNIAISPIYDMQDNKDWSNSVDAKIAEAFDSEIKATIYGSRDAFIPSYNGKHNTVELENSRDISATTIRDSVGDEVRSHIEFRKGVIYAAYNRHPVAFATIDLCCIKREDNKIFVALGRKKNDQRNKWRFPGGFVNPGTDKSLVHTANREGREELKVEFSEPQFIGSSIIDDWRYRNESDSILTSIFIAEYTYGKLRGSDDLDEAKWVLLDEVEKILQEEHMPILNILRTHLEKESVK